MKNKYILTFVKKPRTICGKLYLNSTHENETRSIVRSLKPILTTGSENSKNIQKSNQSTIHHRKTLPELTIFLKAGYPSFHSTCRFEQTLKSRAFRKREKER
jgi:hypothetical protein